MVLKILVGTLEKRLLLRVYFIDPRFRYSEGVMRCYESRVGIRILSGKQTCLVEFEESVDLVLGYADEEVYVKDYNDETEALQMRDTILLALYEWKSKTPHFNDLLTKEENNIYEF